MLRIRCPRWLSMLLAMGCALLLHAGPLRAQGVGGTGRNLGGTLQAGNRTAFGTGIQGAPGSRLEALDGTGTISGSERFLRDNRTASQFVGSDSADSGFIGALTSGGYSPGSIGTVFGSGGLGAGGLGTGALGTGGFGSGGFGATGLSGFGPANLNRTNANRTNTNNSYRAINVRTTLRVGFKYAKVGGSKSQERLTKLLNSGRIAKLGDLTVALDQGTATLTGLVATDEDRELAVQLAKLEPAVETVRDELQVASQAPESPSASDLPELSSP